jgi:phage shock protein PspC (stress-responsive transcriptional regulator)
MKKLSPIQPASFHRLQLIRSTRTKFGAAHFIVIARTAREVRMNARTTALVRPRDGAMIAGVCAGIARYFGWDVTLVRFLYVVISIASVAFPGVLVYILLWILMPRA